MENTQDNSPQKKGGSFKAEDLFNQGGPKESNKLLEKDSDRLAYHQTESLLLPYIAKYGLYLEIGNITMTKDVMGIALSTGISGDLVLAFQIPKDAVKTENFGIWPALSPSSRFKVDRINLELFEALKEGRRKHEALKERFQANALSHVIDRLEKISKSEKGIAWFPPQHVDWEESKRATAIFQLKTFERAKKEISEKEKEAFEPWYSQLVDAQSATKLATT